MALITGSYGANDTAIDVESARKAFSITGKVAGEALKSGAFVFVASDGDIEESDIVSGSHTLGVTARQHNASEAVTVYGEGTILANYSSGMTPGTVLFLSGTDPGSVDDAASVADQKGVAVVITARDIMVTRADGQQRGEGF